MNNDLVSDKSIVREIASAISKDLAFLKKRPWLFKGVFFHLFFIVKMIV